MERPGGHSGYATDEDTLREQQKWDAWDAQKGLGRTEAKRRYIEALIETMRRYASTTSYVPSYTMMVRGEVLTFFGSDSRELLSELEFVWGQVSNNYSSSSNNSPLREEYLDPSSSQQRRFAAPRSGSEGPMKVLYPMSEESEGMQGSEASEEDEEDKDKPANWKDKVESTLVKMTAEMAALREQISNGREWRNKRRRTISSWISWLFWFGVKQAVVDVFLLLLLLLWMRKKRDRRLEDMVREYLRLGRTYVRRYLPARPPLGK